MTENARAGRPLMRDLELVLYCGTGSLSSNVGLRICPLMWDVSEPQPRFILVVFVEDVAVRS